MPLWDLTFLLMCPNVPHHHHLLVSQLQGPRAASITRRKPGLRGPSGPSSRPARASSDLGRMESLAWPRAQFLALLSPRPNSHSPLPHDLPWSQDFREILLASDTQTCMSSQNSLQKSRLGCAAFFSTAPWTGRLKPHGSNTELWPPAAFLISEEVLGHAVILCLGVSLYHSPQQPPHSASPPAVRDSSTFSTSLTAPVIPRLFVFSLVLFYFGTALLMGVKWQLAAVLVSNMEDLFLGLSHDLSRNIYSAPFPIFKSSYQSSY